MSKRYEHDCNSCIFLGQYNQFDLYICPGQYPTVIGRKSSEPSDYSSSAIAEYVPSNNSLHLAEAIQRAKTRNLI